MVRRVLGCFLTLATLASIPVAADSTGKGRGADRLDRIKHIVVIYEENHSFDNLYGSWEGVNGVANATPDKTAQVNQSGTPYSCLLQNDVNLKTPPLAATCSDATTGTPFTSHFANAPFTIDDYIPPTAL